LDLSKVAIGGSSAGANIAAVLAQNAILRPQLGVSICSQFLAVPVTDNTATPLSNPTWKSLELTAALPAEKMLWYRRHYLPCPGSWSHREASPLLASDEIFERLPPANIIVGEMDMLRHEGEEYARRLRDNGVSATLTLMEGMPHPFLAMDAVLEAGRRAITIICEGLAGAFA
jgi:triacylglycerol lipase